MKKIFSVLFCILLAFPSFAQQQKVEVGASASAVVHHAQSQTQYTETLRPWSALIGFHNIVDLKARHCQAYAANGVLTAEGRASCFADPSTLFYHAETHNLVTNAGFTMIEQAISNTATQPASCNYIAMAADSSNGGAGTVNATDTALNSSGTGSTEITTNGFARNLSPREVFSADTPTAKQYTVSKTFTATGSQAAGINKIGLFNATSAGTMCYEALVTPIGAMNTNDTLTITWTATLS